MPSSSYQVAQQLALFFLQTSSNDSGVLLCSALQFMKDFYNYTYYDRIGEYMNEFYLTLLWSITVSMFPFGGFLGSIMVGPLVNNLGR